MTDSPCPCRYDEAMGAILFCPLHQAAGELLKVAKAILLWNWIHWDERTQAEWLEITGAQEATTKVLCDFARAAIARAEGR